MKLIREKHVYLLISDGILSFFVKHVGSYEFKIIQQVVPILLQEGLIADAPLLNVALIEKLEFFLNQGFTELEKLLLIDLPLVPKFLERVPFQISRKGQFTPQTIVKGISHENVEIR